MSRLGSTCRGHAPHGKLDSCYSVSELRLPRPLYNFRLLDEAQEKLGQRGSACGGKADPLVSSTEFATSGSHNNSAAGRLQLPAGKKRAAAGAASSAGLLNSRQLMENHLRLTYGNELFDSQQYVVKGRLGIAGFPQSPLVSHSSFQAMRGRILGPVPQGTFPNDDGDCDDDGSDAPLDNENCSDSVFQWCDRNNSAEDVAKTCARRAGAKITMRRGLSKWIFLYFRVRRVSWEFMVYEEKMNCSTVDLFSDNVLDRWTVKLRFKMLIDAPMKYPLMAFLSRMGLDTDPDIVFSVDGFFGDMLVGGAKNRNSIPHRQVSFNTTPEAMGLQNGDNIFVVKANSTLRNNVEAHMEMAKRRANKTDGDDEEDEDEDIEEDEEDHH